jgi:hypothetical protein
MTDETVIEESGSTDNRRDLAPSQSQPGPTYINPNEDETYVPAEEDNDTDDDTD